MSLFDKSEEVQFSFHVMSCQGAPGLNSPNSFREPAITYFIEICQEIP
jgi:hypothetical protein